MGWIGPKSSHTTIDVAATEKELNCVTAAVGRKSNTTHYDNNTYSALMFKRMNELSTDTHTHTLTHNETWHSATKSTLKLISIPLLTYPK